MKWRGNLRTLVVAVSLAIAVAFAGLGGGLLEALSQLNANIRDEGRVAAQLQRAGEVEALALQINRAPAQGQNWTRPDALMGALTEQASASAETIQRARGRYQAMKRDVNPSAVGADESAFLDSMREFRSGQWRDLQDVTQRSDQLGARAKRAAGALALFSFLTLGLALGELWKRVFGPIVALSRVAKRFGEGDLSARAALPPGDEMGALGSTFNAMAAGIQERENERLRFVAGLAHDLKNPLVVVGGAAQLLRRHGDDLSPPQRDEWLGKIANNALRMEALIADLTDAVQGQTGALQLNLRSCDLAALGREALSECHSAFPHHKFEFDGPDTLLLDADAPRIERVLANLLSNAAKYSPSGKTVTLHLRRGEERVEIEVEDEGAGIAPADLKRLFQPFVRLDNARALAGGTGLGLVSVRRIARAHGGDTWAQSEPGRGSKFGFTLPLGKRAFSPRPDFPLEPV